MTAATGSAASSGGLGSLSPLIGAVLGVFALVVIVGVAVAYFRATYVKATIETLKASNDAYSDRIDQLEADAVQCKTRLDASEHENASLRTYVSGTEAIKDLAATMREQHGDLMGRVAAILDQQAAILDRPRRSSPARKATAKKPTTRRSR